MSTREVELTGGAPWGFRMHGGADQNQPLRISRVNPGRKASLSGIREGDVISSINGKSTRSMSNADAHAMLRSAGPVLRLGLNEDREMSPRRRSIGKGTELKRPSQLIAETNRATLQAPVYATIRPSQSPQNRLTTSPLRSSLNSLPSALNSTPLVKAVTAAEEPMRFHPTNPFYTTLPSNYTSASKLPVPNGRVSISGLDRSRSVTKTKDTPLDNSNTDLKSPSFFNNISESGPSSLQHGEYVSSQINGHGLGATSNIGNNGDPFFYYKYNQIDDHISPKEKIKTSNPFETGGINKDPFEKYLQPDKLNGKYEYDSKILSNSLSDSNFRTNEEITKRSTITEHKISEVEEVKTIKKIILNGSGDNVDHQKDMDFKISSPTANTKNEEIFSNTKRDPFNKENQSKSSRNIFGNENIPETAKHRNYDFFSSPIERTIETNFRDTYEPPREESRNRTHSAETPKSEAVPDKPPATPLNSPTPVPPHTSPTTKRK